MPFDLNAAKQAGYSSQEIADFLASQKSGFDLDGARKAGYGDDEIIGFLGADNKPQAEQLKPTVSGLESGYRGFEQGATAGFGDEIKGTIGAAFARMMRPDLFKDQSFSDTYKEGRNMDRSANKAASDANPWTYGLANVAGGVVTGSKLPMPVSTAGKYAAGAGLGATAGYGNSDSETASGQIMDTVLGGFGGVAGTYAGNKIGQGLSALANSKTGQAVGSYLSRSQSVDDIANTIAKTPEQKAVVVEALQKGATPQEAAILIKAQQFNVPLSRGDVTRTAEQQGMEDLALRGGFGDQASQVARGFRSQQEQALRDAAKGLTEKISGAPYVDNMADVGAKVSSRLKSIASVDDAEVGAAYKKVGEANISTLATKAQAPEGFDKFIKMASKAKDANDFIEKARKIKGVPESTSQWFGDKYNKPGVSMSQAVQGFLDDVKSGLFNSSKETGALRKLGETVAEIRNPSGNYTLDDTLTPASKAALARVDGVLQKKNPSLSELDTLRRVLNDLGGSAKNPTDARNITAMKSALSASLDDAIEGGFVQGDQNAIKNLRLATKTARDYFSRWKADDAVQKIVEENYTPEAVVNLVRGYGQTGGNKQAAELVGKLGDILGKDSEEFALLKQAQLRQVFGKNLDSLLAGDIQKGFSAEEVNKNLTNLLTNNKSLADAYFSPQEQTALKDFLDVAYRATNRVQGAVNYSNTAPALIRAFRNVANQFGILGRIAGAPVEMVNMGAQSIKNAGEAQKAIGAFSDKFSNPDNPLAAGLKNRLTGAASAAGALTVGSQAGTKQSQPVRITITPQDKLPEPVPNERLPQISPQSNAAPLFQRVIHAESAGNQNAVSPKGAIGVAQIMPGTAREAAEAAGLPYDPFRLRNDAQYNAALGAAYLSKLQAKYQNDALALAAYNWGPGNVDMWLKSGADPRKLPRETQNYLQRILG